MNKPGQDVSNLQGGVSEGSILEELLRARYGIKLWPGIFNKANGVKWDWGNVKHIFWQRKFYVDIWDDLNFLIFNFVLSTLEFDEK